MKASDSKRKEEEITTKQDVAYVLSRNIVRTRYEDLSPEVVEATKRSILDILGVTAAASTQGEGSKEIVGLVKESGAKGKSTIIGYGGRVPSWLAGFANGAMTHELDYDDTHDEARMHPSACAVPAAFATAEEVGKVNGKEFITAVALAIDLGCRMSLAIQRSSWGDKSDWSPPHVFGYFVATASSGRILRLDEDGMLNAFGHALQQVAGSREAIYSPGSVFRGIRDGFSILSGMLAAIMAKRRLPGCTDSMEGRAGLYNLYFRGIYERSYLTDDLGKRFEGTGVSFKPWPSCRFTHASVDATLEILREQNIPPEDIAEILVLVDEHALHNIEPLGARRRPQTFIDAKVSIPFTVAVAASRRKVVIKDFTLEGLKNPHVLQMAQKVAGRIEPKLAGKPHSSIVEIRTLNGRHFSNQIDIPYGHPKKPIAKEDLVAKFKDCVTYSAKPLSRRDAEKIIVMIDRLEEVPDVGEVVRLLG